MKATLFASFVAGLVSFSLVGCQAPNFSTQALKWPTHKTTDKQAKEQPAKPAAASADPTALAAAEVDPAQLDRLIQQGYAAERQNQLDIAKGIYAQVIQQNPNHAVANHRLAVIHDQLAQQGNSKQNFALARQYYQKAVASNPQDANLLSDVGYSYLLQKDYAQSERYLQQAVTLDPTHRQALNNLGLLYGKKGDRDGALAYFRRTGSEQEALAKMARLFPQTGQPSFGELANSSAKSSAAWDNELRETERELDAAAKAGVSPETIALKKMMEEARQQGYRERIEKQRTQSVAQAQSIYDSPAPPENSFAAAPQAWQPPSSAAGMNANPMSVNPINPNGMNTAGMGANAYPPTNPAVYQQMETNAGQFGGNFASNNVPNGGMPQPGFTPGMTTPSYPPAMDNSQFPAGGPAYGTPTAASTNAGTQQFGAPPPYRRSDTSANASGQFAQQNRPTDPLNTMPIWPQNADAAVPQPPKQSGYIPQPADNAATSYAGGMNSYTNNAAQPIITPRQPLGQQPAQQYSAGNAGGTGNALGQFNGGSPQWPSSPAVGNSMMNANEVQQAAFSTPASDNTAALLSSPEQEAIRRQAEVMGMNAGPGQMFPIITPKGSAPAATKSHNRLTGHDTLTRFPEPPRYEDVMSQNTAAGSNYANPSSTIPTPPVNNSGMGYDYSSQRVPTPPNTNNYQSAGSQGYSNGSTTGTTNWPPSWQR